MRTCKFGVVPGGFEPPSQAPKACMLDHYTTGLHRSSFRQHLILSETHGRHPPSPTAGAPFHYLLVTGHPRRTRIHHRLIPIAFLIRVVSVMNSLLIYKYPNRRLLTNPLLNSRLLLLRLFKCGSRGCVWEKYLYSTTVLLLLASAGLGSGRPEVKPSTPRPLPLRLKAKG